MALVTLILVRVLAPYLIPEFEWTFEWWMWSALFAYAMISDLK